MKLGLKTLLGLTAAVAGLSVVTCKNAASDGGGGGGGSDSVYIYVRKTDSYAAERPLIKVTQKSGSYDEPENGWPRMEPAKDIEYPSLWWRHEVKDYKKGKDFFFKINNGEEISSGFSRTFFYDGSNCFDSERKPESKSFADIRPITFFIKKAGNYKETAPKIWMEQEKGVTGRELTGKEKGSYVTMEEAFSTDDVTTNTWWKYTVKQGRYLPGRKFLITLSINSRTSRYQPSGSSYKVFFDPSEGDQGFYSSETEYNSAHPENSENGGSNGGSGGGGADTPQQSRIDLSEGGIVGTMQDWRENQVRWTTKKHYSDSSLYTYEFIAPDSEIEWKVLGQKDWRPIAYGNATVALDGTWVELNREQGGGRNIITTGLNREQTYQITISVTHDNNKVTAKVERR